ncbi:MAG: IS5 family transposase [Chloroflexi bacterium]|nr:IS5 family transposase [Chloroflexota bacterium]
MFHGLTDEQWALLAPPLPAAARTGRPRADDRQTLEGILYVLQTGSRWQDLPRQYGSPVTCWRRLRRWQEDGMWKQIRQALLQTLDEREGLDWNRISLDATFVPAKKGAAPSA